MQTTTPLCTESKEPMLSQYTRAAAEWGGSISKRGKPIHQEHMHVGNLASVLYNQFIRTRRRCFCVSSAVKMEGAAPPYTLRRWDLHKYNSNRYVNLSICSCVKSCNFHKHECYKPLESTPSSMSSSAEPWKRSFCYGSFWRETPIPHHKQAAIKAFYTQKKKNQQGRQEEPKGKG